MDCTLKIVAWNSNGLTQHGPELTEFIRFHDIDIMLISETHYTNRSFLKIHNYKIYDTKHPDGTAHGGSAIIIKNSIKHYESLKFQTDHIQATSIVIQDLRGPITISAIYCPPRHIIKENKFTEFFTTLGNRFLAGGDYNAKHQRWGSRVANPKGRELLKCMEKNNFSHLSTGKPTYWPSDRNKTPDLIDFCVTKGLHRDHLLIEENLELSSDHTPIMITLSNKIIKKIKPATLCNKRTDWELFRKLLEERLELNFSLKTAEEIDNAVQKLTCAIQNAAWDSTPETNTLKKQNCSNSIKKAILEKRKLRKVWMETRSPHDKAKFNKSIRDLKVLISEEKNLAIQQYLIELSPTEATEYSLWKATRNIKQAQEHIPPIRKPDRNWARDDQEKADTFAEHLANVFQPFPREITEEEDDVIVKALDIPHQLATPIKSIKINEVRTTIAKNVNPKKSPGYDLISGVIIKQLPEKALRCLTYIYNAILRLGFFPSQWKAAQIILIPKPGKPAEEVTSYRPISLLPILSKLFEKIFLKRLKPILEEQNIIPEHQFGFREQHSTIEQVHRVVEIIRECLESKKYCSVAFLDITQAFDKVWHQGLLYKLKRNLPHPYYQLFNSYLSDRYFMVKYQDVITGLYPIRAGVPQGSVLGPVLYLLYTSDIPTSPHTTTATFADDTAIMAVNEEPRIASQYLQRSLNELQEWLKTWRIRANETKSVHVTYTLRKGTCPTVHLNNQPLPQTEDAKYLGVHIDRRLTWKKHIFAKRKQLGLKYSKLYWLIGPRSKLSTENKLLVYKVILKPVWTYGVELWGTASSSNLEILQRFQSKTLRTITNAPWYVANDIIHRDLQIVSVKEQAQCASARYLKRLESHPNTLAVNLLDNSNTTYRLKRYHILDLPNR